MLEYISSSKFAFKAPWSEARCIFLSKYDYSVNTSYKIYANDENIHESAH